MWTIEHYLLHALNEAQKGRGFCAPNPAVGAIVVKNNEILSKGYHHGYGMAHAEVDALAPLIESEATQSTLYVTLEPCCHWGKTPPCTDIIQKKGIQKVIYGMRDPNPHVSGRTARLLKEKGIACDFLELPEIQDFYRSYIHWHEQKKPWIKIKLALSLDGKIAGSKGEPLAITGKEAKMYTHEQRMKSDGILTTVKTILRDDPQLNVRLKEAPIPKPLYILDKHLDLPETAQILKTAKKITLFYEDSSQCTDKLKQFNEQGITCVPIKTNANNHLDLTEIVTYLGEKGIHDLWVEAGGTLATSFMEQDLCDEWLIYVAPKILGNDGLSAFNHPWDFTENARSIRWQSLGNDVLCHIIGK